MAAQELFTTSLFNDANLIHYYRLEGLTDSKGSNTLINNNTVAFNAALFGNGGDMGASNTNKSLSFAGNEGYTGGTYTVNWWMKLNTEVSASGDYYPLILGDATSITRLDFFYEYNGGSRQIRAGRTRSNVSNDFITPYAVTLGTSNWHMLTNAYGGSSGVIYLDGASIGTYTSSGNGSVSESSALHIGSSNVPDHYTSAIFDDASFFTRQLTATEVSNLFNGFPLSGGSFLLNFL